MKTRSLRVALLALIAAVTLTACSGETQAPASAPEFNGAHVDAAAFMAATEVDGVTIVDVRSPEEFAQGHIPGAVNINVEGADFAAQVAALDPEANYAVYCRSGNRSRVAIDFMTQAGVTHTVGLEGGIGAWTGDVVTD